MKKKEKKERTLEEAGVEGAAGVREVTEASVVGDWEEITEGWDITEQWMDFKDPIKNQL